MTDGGGGERRRDHERRLLGSRVVEPDHALSPAASASSYRVAAEGADVVRSIPEIEHRIDALLAVRGRVMVGISGFAGSGKSTLATELAAAVPGYRLRGDDFLDPQRSHRRSGDWDGVDRDRLVSTVLQPFRGRRPARFRRFDWTRRELGEEELLPSSPVVVLDAIGLLHPAVLPWLDLAIWVDTRIDVAAARGRARDRELGRDHDRLWDEVWTPNDRDFARRFTPWRVADLLWPNDLLPSGLEPRGFVIP